MVAGVGVLCIGASWQASGRAGGRKRGKLEEQKEEGMIL